MKNIRTNQPTINQQKQISKFYSSAISLISLLLKQKRQNNLKWSLQKIKNHSKSSNQKSKLFEKLLNKITTKKNLQYKKLVINQLIQFKIKSIIQKRAKIQNLKIKKINHAASLLFIIMVKNLKNKVSSVFNQLRSKSTLLNQKKTLKTYKLVNSINRMHKKLMNSSLKAIKWDSFLLLSKYKRCFVITDLFARKRSQNIQYALSKLRNKSIKLQSSNNKQQSKPQQDTKILQELNSQSTLLKQLQDRKKQLQTQLKQKKNTQRTSLKSKQDQLNKIQEQFESLKFSIDIINQQNQQLKQNIKQRQKAAQLSKQKNKSVGEPIQNGQVNNFRNFKLMSQNQIWKSIMNTFILFLYKQKNLQNNKSTSIFIQDLLDKLTLPNLDISSIFNNPSQLVQQNRVLQELLNSYKAAFSNLNIKNINPQNQPIDPYILSRCRKYYYQVVECLSRWGTSQNSLQIEQIRSAIQKIKLNQNIQSSN